MTTTDVMEGEDIGGLTRRHFLKMVGIATGVATAGLAAAVLLSEDTLQVSEKPAIVVPFKEKSGKYKTLTAKYAEQIEAGKKYVAEKYGLLTGQVEAVVLDEIKPRHGPEDYNSSGSILVGGGSPVSHRKEFLPEDESGLYVVYLHPEGYTAVVISRDNRTQPDFKFLFCTPEIREVVKLFLQKYEKKEIAVLDVKRLNRGDIMFYGDKFSEPESDRIYGVYFRDSWDHMCFQDDGYAIDLGSEKILGRITFGFHFLSKDCE